MTSILGAKINQREVMAAAAAAEEPKAASASPSEAKGERIHWHHHSVFELNELVIDCVAL